jgi:large subunit ribosomal protein L3
VDAPKPTLLGYPGFKAGTIHVVTIDDRQRTPNSGKPFFNVASVLAVPEAEVKGLRLYGRENGHEVALGEARNEPQKLVEKVPAERVSRVAAFVSAVPSEVGLSQNKPIEFEVGVGGGDARAQVDYAAGLVGKKVKFSDAFKPGMFVDVLGITKGKGFEGPVTRFGIKRKQHKSRKSVRAVGVIGPWHPAAVMYTIARAGQKGFAQRTETGRRIISVANAKDAPITPAGGFLHFGEVKGDYAVLRGTIPGPASRFSVVRLSVRRKQTTAPAPQVIEVSTRLERGGR